jgi:hypothetical protein
VSRPVYSSPFINWSDAAPNATFEVPSGFTAVVREFDACTVLGDVLIGLYIADSVDASAVYIHYGSVLGAAQSDQWQGRVVVPENGIIGIVGAALGYELGVYVGGYLLTNTT